jgi:hypothetical protein
MIFRLEGRIEETLALTPVIRCWKEITGNTVWVNTMFPSLFRGNLSVDGLTQDNLSDDVMADFNKVEWQVNLKPVVESYMEYILGKQRPLFWRTQMFHTEEDSHKAESLIPNARSVVLSMTNPPDGLVNVLASKGYFVVKLTAEECSSLHVFRAVVDKANLYIGDDGDDTAIALTTDIPAVVCYIWRSPAYFAPFRRGEPFEIVSPKKSDCLYADGCMISNGLFEMGRTYGVKCPMPEMTCKKAVRLERIIEAVEKVEAKA